MVQSQTTTMVIPVFRAKRIGTYVCQGVPCSGRNRDKSYIIFWTIPGKKDLSLNFLLIVVQSWSYIIAILTDFCHHKRI